MNALWLVATTVAFYVALTLYATPYFAGLSITNAAFPFYAVALLEIDRAFVGLFLGVIGATLCFGAFLAFRYYREDAVAEKLAGYELPASSD